jgi:hypothetical protein
VLIRDNFDLGTYQIPRRWVGHIAQSCVIFITPRKPHSAHLWHFPTPLFAYGPGSARQKPRTLAISAGPTVPASFYSNLLSHGRGEGSPPSVSRKELEARAVAYYRFPSISADQSGIGTDSLTGPSLRSAKNRPQCQGLLFL